MQKLFNNKTMRRHALVNPIPEVHLEILANWREMITSSRIYQHKETSLQAEFRQNLIEKVLGYKGPIGNISYTLSTE